MAEQIELKPLPLFDVRVDLDGVEYLLVFRYLQRTDRWAFSVYTGDGTAIREGAACLLSVRQLMGNTHPSRPPGELIFVDSSQKGLEAGFEDLGARVTLQYLSKAEVVTLYA